MKTLDSGFLAAIAATVTRPLHLVEIAFTAPLRLATREGVTWNGCAWSADRVLKVEGLGQDGTGKVGAKITIGNHDDLLGAYLLNERIADRAINIWEAWLDESGAMVIRQVLAGIGGQATCGAEIAVIDAVGGNTLAHAPRQLIRTAVGWPPPKPNGFTFTWNGTAYTVEGRQ